MLPRCRGRSDGYASMTRASGRKRQSPSIGMRARVVPSSASQANTSRCAAIEIDGTTRQPLETNPFRDWLRCTTPMPSSSRRLRTASSVLLGLTLNLQGSCPGTQLVTVADDWLGWGILGHPLHCGCLTSCGRSRNGQRTAEDTNRFPRRAAGGEDGHGEGTKGIRCVTRNRVVARLGAGSLGYSSEKVDVPATHLHQRFHIRAWLSTT